MHRISALLVVVCLLVASMFGMTGTASAAAQVIGVVIDGKKQVYDQPPVLINGRTLVPLRGIFEALGAEITWNQATETVTATRGNTTVVLKIGSKLAMKNGQPVHLDVEARLIKNRTMVPIRFVSEAMDADVKWDQSTFTVHVTSRPWDPATGEKLTTQQIVQQNDKKVVMIETDQSFGSGIAVRDGLFLTNYHVMEGASEAVVTTIDGREYNVQGLVAYDENLDLALIKTTTQPGIPGVRVGSPKQSLKGDDVVAIGSPNGLQNTVSEGIISGLRTEDGVDLVQITSEISPGSSGGALFNELGEVIGVTTFSYGDSGALNFAVSIDHLSKWNDLLNKSFSTLTASFPEVPISDVQAIENFMNKKYDVINTSRASINIIGWDVEVSDYDGFVSMVAMIDPNDYLDYLDHYYAIEGELEDYIQGMYDDLEANFPGENMHAMVFFSGYGEEYPEGFDSEEITYVEEDGVWLVTHWLFSLIIDGGEGYFELRP